MNYGVKYSTVQTSAPAAEPISTSEAKTHLNVSISADDTFIGTLIVAARRHVEQITGRQLINATWRLSMDRFPTEIQLPYPPYSSVTSIAYTDAAGTSQTLAASAYQIDSDAEPARIRPAWGYAWPSIRDVYRAVQVTYVAGYGSAGTSVPADILVAIKSIIGVMYEFREAVITGTIVNRIDEVANLILWPYRVMTF